MKKLTFGKIVKYIFIFFLVLFLAKILASTYSDTLVIRRDGVVVIELNGIISGADNIISIFKKFKDNVKVKGFILRINSPGGVIAPTQEIHRFIGAIEKPIYASIGTVGASGGYYVAVACDEIYALPGSITGSIGVIAELSNFKNLLDKLGVDVYNIKSGKYKDTGSPFRKMDNSEEKLFQEYVNEMYEQFVQDIKGSRNIDNSTLAKYADGRIFTGNFAKSHGFIDGIGSYEDAFNDMKELLGMQELEMYKYKEKSNMLKDFLVSTRSFATRFLLPDGFYFLLRL